jgi:hypothetical protein
MNATGAKPAGAVIILQSSAITKAERGSMAQSASRVINTGFDLLSCRRKFESRLRMAFAFGKSRVPRYCPKRTPWRAKDNLKSTE